VEAWMCDGMNRVRVLLPGEYTIPAMEGRKLSLLAYTPQVTGVCLQGAEWELQDATLDNSYPLGCSNEFVGPQARLSFAEGALMLICAKEHTSVKD